MVFLLVLGAAVALALALGGRLRALGTLELRAPGLFFAAIALQLVAFPPDLLPWNTGDAAARWLWLASYVSLVCGAVVNVHLRGAVLVAAGMVSNLMAIVANGGLMPRLPGAAHAAGSSGELVHLNSVTTTAPRVPWLVDRWAAPDWLPLANVYSVGDVVLALGALVLVLAAMRVPLLGRLPAPRLALR